MLTSWQLVATTISPAWGIESDGTAMLDAIMQWSLGLSLVGLPAICVYRLLVRVIPPSVWYVSPTKRRAMRFALESFASEHPKSQAVWRHCWVHKIDSEKCFVFVRMASGHMHPPCHAGYVVWHNRYHVDYLGVCQFHWGIRPYHVVEHYESQREGDEIRSL